MTDILTTTQIKAVDKKRGHRFCPPKKDLAKIPGLYETEEVSIQDKIAHLHFFSGGADWYIFELDKDTGVAFGWAELHPGCGEWGYIDLVELGSVDVGFPAVERDCWFSPTPISELDKLK